MKGKKKALAANQGGSRATRRASISNHTPIIPQTARPLQVEVNKLLAQADRLMTNDKARYADHYQVWLSLCYLKNGWPWGAQ